MQTVDFHTHLLSPQVRFNRLFDRLAVCFFARSLGADPVRLAADPYATYTDTLMQLVRESMYIKKIVLFGVDAKLDSGGDLLHRDATVCADNEDLLELYRANRDIVIPFFSINPLRPDALDLIDRYSELGFRGAKFLQNYWGVDTRQERFGSYFEKLRQKNLPLIMHMGSESSVPSVRACEGLEMLAHPLAAGVRVVAAHMAITYEPLHLLPALSRKEKNFNPEYFRLLEMLESHANLYADISCLLSPVRAKVLPHLSTCRQIHHKLLFATDYPVPFSMLFNTSGLPVATRIRLGRICNPFDRYVSTILRYFPEHSPLYTNYRKVLAS